MLQSDMRMSRTRILSISLTVSSASSSWRPMRTAKSRWTTTRPIVVGYFRGDSMRRQFFVKDLISRGAVPILDQINYSQANIANNQCIVADPVSDLDLFVYSRQQRGWHCGYARHAAQRKLPSTTGTETALSTYQGADFHRRQRGCVRPSRATPKSQCFRRLLHSTIHSRQDCRWSRSAEFVRRHRC